MSKLRLLALAGLLAAAAWPLSGCGQECGPGSTEKDGQCVLTADGCADGTRLVDGQCLVDDSGCGDGTMLSDDGCVPTSETCYNGSTFDEGQGICIPDTEVVCGEGTEIGDAGACVPSSESCGDKTRLDESGRCVVEAAACGQGTALDANTGECIVADAACADGLALDADTGACVPTDSVCDAGTKFDAESGMCLNDSCHAGDVLADGVCMTPAEDLAGDVHLTERENNDPAFGGTVEPLEPGTVDEGPFVFAGAIGQPADLDADGAVDQDRDVFGFQANAGQWLEVTVQSTGLQAPAFVVEGPNGYVRYSQLASNANVARDIVIPADGAYTITVVPSQVLARDGAVEPMGSEDWTYVGTVDTVAAPSPTSVAIDSGDTLSGDFLNTRDNLFEVTGLQPGDSLRLEANDFGAHTDGLLQVWSDPSTLASSQPLAARQVIDFGVTGSSALVLVDWSMMRSAVGSFELSLSISGGETTLTLAPDATHTITVPALAGDQLLVRQSNPNAESLAVLIEDDGGNEVDSSEALASGSALSTNVDADGDYTVTFTNKNAANVDATMIAHTVRPLDLGNIPAGEQRSAQPFDVSEDYDVDITFSVDPGEIVKIGHSNAQDDSISYDLLDSQGTVIKSDDFLSRRDLWGEVPDNFAYLVSDSSDPYTFRVRSNIYDPNDVVVTVENLGLPTSHLGDVGAGQSASASYTTALAEGEMRLFTVNASAAGTMLIEALAPDRADVDVWVYDSALVEDSTTGFPEDSTTDNEEQFALEVSGGTYYIIAYAAEPLGGVDLSVALDPPAPTSSVLSSAPSVSIPYGSSGTSDSIAVTGCNAVEYVSLYVNITGADVSKLDIELTSPLGTVVPISTGDVGEDPDLVGWFPQTFIPAGNLYDFTDEYGNGEWTINVASSDFASGDTFEEWKLALECG